MADYSVTFARSARKELEKLPSSVARRIIQHIEALLINPRPTRSVKLQGNRSLWRIRVGDYRVIYQVNDAARIIDVSIIRPETIAFAAQFGCSGRGAGALLAGTRLDFRLFLGQLRLSYGKNFIDNGAGSAQQSGVLEARVPWASTHPRRFFLWLTLIPRVHRSFPVRICPALSSLGALFMVRRSSMIRGPSPSVSSPSVAVRSVPTSI